VQRHKDAGGEGRGIGGGGGRLTGEGGEDQARSVLHLLQIHSRK
jgi:hypothetical protein